MNERDSEDVAAKLQARGYELVDSEERADIVLLNTCSVREHAERKAIGKAGNISSSRKKEPNFILGIMGCMAQNRGGQLLSELPDLDLIVGTQKFHRIPDFLEELQSNEKKVNRLEIGDEEDSQSEIKDHFESGNKRISSFVSIMQGCNMKCSFCIVPKTRGKERYRSIHEIVEEVKQLASAGTKEVTLLGQIVNAYGRGKFKNIDGKTPFVQLLEKINDIKGIERIRFTSPHPTSFGKDLIHAFGDLKKLGSYAHLPMQSGSNKILKSMNRPYSSEKFIRLVRELRRINPKMRLSTDVIVGYPGESEEDFNQTKKVFIECGFEMAFIFKYSERVGTPAARYEDKVPAKIKDRRNQELLKLLEEQSLASNKKLIGTNLEVLIEGSARKGEGKLVGRTACYRKVIFNAKPRLIGELVLIKINDATPNTLFGEIIVGL